MAILLSEDQDLNNAIIGLLALMKGILMDDLAEYTYSLTLIRALKYSKNIKNKR